MNDIQGVANVFNVDDLILRHARWLIKFESAILKKETFDVKTIADSDACVTGRWLHSYDVILKIGEWRSYRNCVKVHKAFHTEMGEIAKIINEQEGDKSLFLSNKKSRFHVASGAVIAAIVGLKRDMILFGVIPSAKKS